MNIITVHRHLPYRLMWPFMLISATLSILLCSPLSAQAKIENPNGKNVQITLSPTNRTMDIKASTTYNESFAIYNSGDVELDFTVYAKPYQVKNTSYDPLFNKDTDRTQIARWVHFPQKQYRLAPGEKADVLYTITTPDSIPSGGQYAALFAQTEATDSGSIISQKRVGMILYAHAEGASINKGSSEDPKLGFWQSAPTLTVHQKVKNSGNTDFTTKVTMDVSDVFGNKKFTSTTSKAILPDTTRAIEIEWPDAPSFALMNVTMSVTFLGQTLQYKHMILFATPTALFFIIAAAVLIITGGVYVFKKRHVRSSSHDK